VFLTLFLVCPILMTLKVLFLLWNLEENDRIKLIFTNHSNGENGTDRFLSFLTKFRWSQWINYISFSLLTEIKMKTFYTTTIYPFQILKECDSLLYLHKTYTIRYFSICEQIIISLPGSDWFRVFVFSLDSFWSSNPRFAFLLSFILMRWIFRCFILFKTN